MTMHVPPEAVPLTRRRRLDWRFLVALTALILVCLLVWASIRNYDVRAAEAAQKDALIVQLDQRADHVEALQDEVAMLTARILTMQDQARGDRRAARQERRQAHRERQRLIRQQARMIRILQRFGAPVPRSLVSSSRVSRSSSPARTSSSTYSPARTYTTPRSTSKPRPAPTAGKSGKTPKGKAKGLRR